MPKVFNGSLENAFWFSSKFVPIEELVISNHKNDIDFETMYSRQKYYKTTILLALS